MFWLPPHFSQRNLCPTGKILRGAKVRKRPWMETGELLWRGRMRALNADLYFCKLETNFASFVLLYPAPLLSSTSTGSPVGTAASPLRKKCHSKMLVLLQVPLSTFCKPRVSLNFEKAELRTKTAETWAWQTAYISYWKVHAERRVMAHHLCFEISNQSGSVRSKDVFEGLELIP